MASRIGETENQVQNYSNFKMKSSSTILIRWKRPCCTYPSQISSSLTEEHAWARASQGFLSLVVEREKKYPLLYKQQEITVVDFSSYYFWYLVSFVNMQ